MGKQTTQTIHKSDKSELLLMELLQETKRNNSKKVEFNAQIKYDTSWDNYKKKYYS